MNVPLRESIASDKPREKFLHHGPQALSDHEILAILLRTGVKGKSVLEVSKEVLKFLPGESLYYLSETNTTDLCSIHGIGIDKAITIGAAIELGRRIARQRVKQSAPDFSAPGVIAQYVMEDMRFLQQECFAAAYLSTKNRLIAWQTLTVGTLNASFAKARDVFRAALRYNAAAVVLIHNHPSGDPEPSFEDIAVTELIVKAGDLMEIPVLDHIIIGDGTFVSLCERGYV